MAGQDQTLIAGGSYSNTTTSFDQPGAACKGIIVTVYIPALGAPNTTDSITLLIQGKEFTQAGKYYPLMTGAAIVGSSNQAETIVVYRMFPGAAGVNTASFGLPGTWRVQMQHSTPGVAWTYAVAVSYLA